MRNKQLEEWLSNYDAACRDWQFMSPDMKVIILKKILSEYPAERNIPDAMKIQKQIDELEAQIDLLNSERSVRDAVETPAGVAGSGPSEGEASEDI